MKQCEILHLKDLYKKSAIMILFKIKQEEMPDILLDCASWAEERRQSNTHTEQIQKEDMGRYMA